MFILGGCSIKKASGSNCCILSCPPRHITRAVFPEGHTKDYLETMPSFQVISRNCSSLNTSIPTAVVDSSIYDFYRYTMENYEMLWIIVTASATMVLSSLLGYKFIYLHQLGIRNLSITGAIGVTICTIMIFLSHIELMSEDIERQSLLMSTSVTGFLVALHSINIELKKHLVIFFTAIDHF